MAPVLVNPAPISKAIPDPAGKVRIAAGVDTLCAFAVPVVVPHQTVIPVGRLDSGKMPCVSVARLIFGACPGTPPWCEFNNPASTGAPAAPAMLPLTIDVAPCATVTT